MKYVLESLQRLRLQVLFVPQKVLDGIQALCCRFLWTGGTENSPEPVVEWTSLLWAYGIISVPKTCFVGWLAIHNSMHIKPWKAMESHRDFLSSRECPVLIVFEDG